MGRILSTHGFSLTGSAGFEFNTLNYSFVIERAVNIHITVRPTTSRRRLHRWKNWRSRTSSCSTIIESNSLTWARSQIAWARWAKWNLLTKLLGLTDLMDRMASASARRSAPGRAWGLTEVIERRMARGVMGLTELMIHFYSRFCNLNDPSANWLRSDLAWTSLRQVPSDLDFYSEHMKCKYAYWRIKLQSSL
jgi:hypothetical protein